MSASSPKIEWWKYMAKSETQGAQAKSGQGSERRHDDDGPGSSSGQRRAGEPLGTPWRDITNHPNTKITSGVDLASARLLGRVPDNIVETLFTAPPPTQPFSTPFKAPLDGAVIQTRFKYSRLRGRQIRLLSIIGFGSMPVAEIEKHSIDDCPAYCAISYAWGDTQGPTKAFYCSGHSFAVPENAHSALYYICLTANGSTLKIWIDLLCINQQDEAEKAEQVAMMGDIYAQAAQVTIWLGPSMNDSDILIDNMPAVAEWLRDVIEIGGHRLPYAPLPRLAESNAGLLRALGHIYARPWFSRIWPVQEVLLSRSKIFLCGSRKFTWEIFEELTMNLVDLNIFECLESSGAPQDLVEFGARNMNSLRSFSKIPYPLSDGVADKDLLVLLEIARSRHVTEPVDRVWGFIGFTRPDLRTTLQPFISYKKGAKRKYHDTYRRFCKILLLRNPSDSRVLSMAGSYSKRSKLPSWCPDFNAPGSNCGSPLGMNGVPYKAGTPIVGPAVRQSLNFRPFSNTLRLMGFRFDYVVNTAALDDEMLIIPHRIVTCTASRSLIAAWEQWCLAIAHGAYSHHNENSPTEVLDAHWKTLTADHMLIYMPKLEGTICHDMMRQTYLDYCSYLNADDVVKAAAAIPPERRVLLATFMNLVSLNYSRTYFDTRFSRRVGIGPRGMRSGDCVVIINGACTPFILRFGRGKLRRATTQLIGEAYVHGIMYGEAINEGQFEEFSING
ncbi:hypothetical protein K4F52_009837 [Lecanicillium sp. MT-2017a]|nr:hypothetical protein K4F52_009837 [Lecanicillium sp. MT-2017a]